MVLQQRDTVVFVWGRTDSLLLNLFGFFMWRCFKFPFMSRFTTTTIFSLRNMVQSPLISISQKDLIFVETFFSSRSEGFHIFHSKTNTLWEEHGGLFSHQQSYRYPIFRNEWFMLDEMTQWKASQFCHILCITKTQSWCPGLVLS